MRIVEDDLSSGVVAALLEEHLAEMAEHSPPESVHALNLDGIKAPGITLYSAWDGTELLGCGALKQLNAEAGEIKSMRTARRHLRRGVAGRLLEHLLDQARRRGLSRLYLETGSMDHFAPARALYRRYGFDFCEPFGDYVEDPHSVFMTLALDGAGDGGAGYRPLPFPATD